MIGITDSLLIIAVAAVCTFLTRALPFMIFKNAEALPNRFRTRCNHRLSARL